MTKEDNEDFKNSTKCLICDNDYIDNDVKVRDYCQITGKYRGSPHRDCNIINVKLNHKILVVFHNLKNHDSHLIIQELGKLNLKIRVMPNGLEKCMSFTINRSHPHSTYARKLPKLDPLPPCTQSHAFGLTPLYAQVLSIYSSPHPLTP